MVLDSDLLWLAGLVEGEGCFSLTGSAGNKNPTIYLAMVDNEIVLRPGKLVGYPVPRLFARKAPRKDQYVWQITGGKAIAWMQRLAPYLSQRRRARILEITGSLPEAVDPSTSIHWLARLLEAEGTFRASLPSKKNSLGIVLEMTDLDTIERVASLWGVGHTVRKSRFGWSEQYIVARRSGRAADLMRELYPLMGRRRQAQIDQALASYHPERRRYR